MIDRSSPEYTALQARLSTPEGFADGMGVLMAHAEQLTEEQRATLRGFMDAAVAAEPDAAKATDIQMVQEYLCNPAWRTAVSNHVYALVNGKRR